MSGLQFRLTKTVEHYECDANGELSLPMLYNFMLLSSGEQERSLGLADIRQSDGLTWIIIQNDLRMHRAIRAKETVTIETEALYYNQFFTYRCYRILDQQGTCCAEALTTFGLLDIEKRRMARVEERFVAPYYAEPVKASDARQAKLVPFKAGETAILAEQSYRSRVLDIDSNHHVNNTRYLEWLSDVMGMAFYTGHRISALSIKYERELQQDTVVTIRAYDIDRTDDMQQIGYQFLVDGVSHCTVNATWTPY